MVLPLDGPRRLFPLHRRLEAVHHDEGRGRHRHARNGAGCRGARQSQGPPSAKAAVRQRLLVYLGRPGEMAGASRHGPRPRGSLPPDDPGQDRALTLLRSKRKRNSTTITRPAPRIKDCCTLLVAVLMKLAGRKRSACNTMPSASRPGRNSFNAASTALVTATVLAPYCADTLIITPSWPSIAAPPMGGSGASTT